MFGYVNIDKMELKFKEYYSYKGYYCGLCMCLKERYGQLSRMTVNYDMTFLILILSSLYEPKNRVIEARCAVHPVKKQLILQNDITTYATDMNVLLTYYNLIDNWNDERDFKSRAAAAALKHGVKRCISLMPDKVSKICGYLNSISRLENEKVADIDAVSDQFGHLMEEVFLYRRDHWLKTLGKVGFFLGKYIYLLDAYEDMDSDKESGSYNPFNLQSGHDVKDKARNILMLNLSFLSNEVEKLPLIQDKGIIDNILYSGIMNRLKKTDNKEIGIK